MSRHLQWMYRFSRELISLELERLTSLYSILFFGERIHDSGRHYRNERIDLWGMRGGRQLSKLPSIVELRGEISIKNVPKPSFLSLGLGCSLACAFFPVGHLAILVAV